MSIVGLGLVLLALPLSAQTNGTQDVNTRLDCTSPLLQGSSSCQAQTANGVQQQGANAPSQEVNPNPSSVKPVQPLTLGTGGYNQGQDDPTGRRGSTNQNVSPQQPPLAPEPLTEFQRFVASTNGIVLPIYGADLFRRIPTTFAPVESIPVPDDYVLGPEDELLVRIWGPVNFQSPLRIDREGEIFVPQVGPIHVAGIPYREVTQQIRAAVGKIFKNFQLSVDIGQIRTLQVYVTGQARKPGLYTVSSLSTVVNAIFASGGPSVQGSMRDIELRRDGKTVTTIDLYRLLIYGDKSGDAKLLPGDVIYIATVGSQVAVMGSVRRAAIYELLPDETVEQLIADAAGVTGVAAQSSLSIERIDSDGKRQALGVKYDHSGLATVLRAGDLVRVFSVVPEYKDTVTLRGNVANAGRFAWHEGMKVTDLIPDKDALVTRNYWWRRTQLGIPSLEFEPVPGFSSLHQPTEDEPVALRDRNGPTTIRHAGAALNESGAANRGTDTYTLAEGGNSAANADREASIRQTQTQSQERSSSSTLADALTAPSSRDAVADQKLGIANLAPEIDWDYAVVERFNRATLKTELLPFDLGHLVLQHDASQDLSLVPGDVVTIFSEADIRVPLAHQTKFVTLDGEFAHAGIYVAEPGETLRHLVVRAGGLADNAYLYGSEFLRESARRSQQVRIDEYVQKLSQNIARSEVAYAASATSNAQDIASAAAAHESERQLLDGLRQLRATGRVVVDFKPDVRDVTEIPDIPLEDGDRFTVPSRLATVNVIGSVNNPNAFLYIAGFRAGTYLHMAGGPDRNADSDHAFIVRANGEVIARKRSDELWNGTFHNIHLYPGDSVVVPEKTFKPSTLRGFLEFTQIFSQLALGAAAVSILK